MIPSFAAETNDHRALREILDDDGLAAGLEGVGLELELNVFV